jgi:hypothetical protein
MWTVDRLVEGSGGRNVDLSYPQISQVSCELVQRLYPQLFFSVYRHLGDLLGFPRPYYYY